MGSAHRGKARPDRTPGVERVLKAERRARLLGWALAGSAGFAGAAAIVGLAGPWPGAAAALAFLAVAAAVAGMLARPHDPARKASIADPQGIMPDAAAIMSAAPDPMITFAPEGDIRQVNKAAVSLFGPVPAGVLARVRLRAPELRRLIDTALESGAGGRVEYVDPGPPERWLLATVTPLGPPSGLFLLTVRDNSELRRIDRIRADFIANASHELRTPLATIKGFVETLKGAAREDRNARARFLDIMQAQTERMARLVDDLLSLSRLETRPLDLTGEIDLREIVDQVSDALRPLATENQVAIERRFPDAPVLVSGSRDELAQVFENLIENALKYGAAGRRITLTIVGEKAGEGAHVEVRDYGPGIPAEHVPRVTERFYRVDGGSGATKGTGLGLAIVKHIVQRHGARLAIASQVGHGSRFTVHFPPGT